MKFYRLIHVCLLKRAAGLRLVCMLSLLLLSSILLRAQSGSVYNPRSGQFYDSIQEAVDNSAPGDTLRVGPGTYAESVRITQELVLQGVQEGGRSPRIVPPRNLAAIYIINPPRGSEVTIDGFDMEISRSEYGIFSEVVRLVISNSRMTGDGGGVAIKTYIPRGIVLRSNVIQDFHRGLLSDNDSDWSVPEVRIIANTFEDIVEPINMTNCPGAQIESNTLRNREDVTRYRQSSAITLNRSPESRVLSNTICTHHLGVFVVGSDSTLVQDNSIQKDMDTDGAGILIAASSDVTISRNRVEDVEYAMVFNDALRSVVRQNWMEDSEYGLQNGNFSDPAFVVDARQNWWGAADGPSSAGPGHGVAVNPNVLFDPWLSAAPRLETSKCK